MSIDSRPTKRERREARRAEERRKREEQARRGRTTRLLSIAAVAVLVVLGVALAWGPLSARFGGATTAAAQGVQYGDQGRDHINRGQSHPQYGSNPPTSGWHFPDWARWGVHDQPQPDEMLIHNLEHGGIVVHYNCPDGCPELAAQLRDVVASYRSKVLLAPRPDPSVPHRITLSAWSWLDGFNEFDEARIRAFIAAHKDRGPETVPD